MFNNISQTYTLLDASSEIALIFLGTFILGMMLGWFIKPSNNSEPEEKNDDITPLKSSGDDDLQLIEGVGPAIEKLLKKHGIQTYADIVSADVSGLDEILTGGGTRFKMHIPTTWPDQAKLADSGKWSELEEYQDILNGGK